MIVYFGKVEAFWYSGVKDAVYGRFPINEGGKIPRLESFWKEGRTFREKDYRFGGRRVPDIHKLDGACEYFDGFRIMSYVSGRKSVIGWFETEEERNKVFDYMDRMQNEELLNPGKKVAIKIPECEEVELTRS